MTAALSVKDRELGSVGFVNSASVNFIADFVPSKLDESHVNTGIDNKDFVISFICHLIFYVFFCFSLVLHILIDLGLGYFIKNKFIQLTKIGKKTEFGKIPSFA